LLPRHSDIDDAEQLAINMAVEPESEDFPRGVTSLPMELEEFLSRDACSLLIKGGAGTGKTALALTILRALGVRKNFIYLSTRTSPRHFFDYYPWLRDWLAEPPKKGKAQAEMPVPAAFVDARLDEPTQLFERVTGELMDARAPVIVIDTWDSMEELAEGESLEADMRVLQAWCERANARLIVMKEEVLDTSFDSVMDGVLSLKQYEFEGRRTREISFSKLYGINVEHPSYFFTLKDGRFHAFEHYREEDFFAFAALTRVITDVAQELPQTHSTGYRQLDSVLGGGIPSGSLLNLELAPEIHSRTGLVLLGGVIAACAKAGHQVLLYPFRGLDEDFTKNLLKNSIAPSRRKLVSQFWSETKYDETAKGRRTAGERTVETIRLARKRSGDGPVLAILGPENFTPDGGDSGLEDFADSVESGKGAGIVVTRESDKAFSERLSVVGSLYIKVASVRGTLLVQPQRPMSKYFVAEVHKDAESATIDVEPMV
jgi:archaellum biogenesis ATPase FlaH